MRIFILATVSALALSGTAFAAAPPAPDAATNPAPAPTSAEPASAAEPAPATVPAPAETPSPAEAIAAKVGADWGKYDAGSKGNLTKVEFGKWMTDLRTAASQPAPDAAWLKTAFTQTDTDKNGKVTSAELTKFLSAGA